MSMRYGDSTPQDLVVTAVPPEDLSGGANAGLWASLGNYHSAEIHILVGSTAGASCAATLDQATDSSGTSTKTLSFTKYYIQGQILKINTLSSTSPLVGDTVTGGTSSNTGTLINWGQDYLFIRFLAGSTTWTDGEALTFTGGATAVMDGTGEQEDILAEATASSDTFVVLLETLMHYMIPVDQTMLDTANGFDFFQLDLSDAGSSTTYGAAFYIMKGPRYLSYPQLTAIEAQKVA